MPLGLGVSDSLMQDFGDMICGSDSPFQNLVIIVDEVWNDIQK